MVLRPSWGHIGLVWGHLGRSWCHHGATLKPPWAIVGRLGAIARLIWVILGVFAAVLCTSTCICTYVCSYVGIHVAMSWALRLLCARARALRSAQGFCMQRWALRLHRTNIHRAGSTEQKCAGLQQSSAEEPHMTAHAHESIPHITYRR